MKVLIIDDSQERYEAFKIEYDGHEIYHAFNYCDATWLLRGYLPAEITFWDLICFDHDLNDFGADGKEYTGATVARYMANNGLKCGAARVHSHNVEGAKNIISILRSCEVSTDNVYYEPFALIPGCDMKGLKEQYEKVN
jgi:hypothetical protein